MSFVTVLMNKTVSSSLFHAPIPKDPSIHIHSIVEYTREAEISLLIGAGGMFYTLVLFVSVLMIYD